jgi:hypothetical protein
LAWRQWVVAVENKAPSNANNQVIHKLTSACLTGRLTNTVALFYGHIFLRSEGKWKECALIFLRRAQKRQARQWAKSGSVVKVLMSVILCYRRILYFPAYAIIKRALSFKLKNIQ